MSVLRKGSKPWENQRFYVGYQLTPRDSSRNLCFTPLSLGSAVGISLWKGRRSLPWWLLRAVRSGVPQQKGWS